MQNLTTGSVTKTRRFIQAASLVLALDCLVGTPEAQARGFELGPRISVSIPTQESGKSLNSGLGYGFTATFMASPRKGLGVDVFYHRWPGEPELDRSLDRLFSLFSGTRISGTKTTVSVVQATVHVKAFALERGPVLPWMKVGTGLHRINSKLELPVAALQASGWRVSTSGPDNISNEMGFQVSTGLDFGITADTKLSLEVSYLLIAAKAEDITAFTVGMSMLDGPR